MTKTKMQGVHDWWNQRYPEWVPEIALRYLSGAGSMPVPATGRSSWRSSMR